MIDAMGYQLFLVLLPIVLVGVWVAQRGRGGRGIRVVVWTCLAVFVLVAIVLGLQMRKWTYEHNTTLWFYNDIEKNLEYGQRALDEGWLNVYGNVLKEREYDGKYYLDYWPLRLLVMRQWASWVDSRYGPHAYWRGGWEFTSPVLMLNMAMELAAVVAIFLLIWMWRRRDAREEGVRKLLHDAGERGQEDLFRDDGGFRGVGPALIGALLAWFSPATQINAYVWPGYDVWVLPFYLWAVLLGCVNWWFAAGMVLGIGTMLKGQQLLIAPVFVLWPLFMGKPGAAGRWAAGFALAFTGIVAPWLLRDEVTREWMPQALALVAGVLCFCVAMPAAAWLLARSGHSWVRRLLPVRRQLYIAAGALAAALAVCPWRFNSDMTWAKLAFSYGSRKFPSLVTGLADNLTALLGMRFGWQSFQDVVWTIAPGTLWRWPAEPFALTLKMLLGGVCFACLVLCAVGMARHSRRPDVRFLVAMSAPWIVCFAIGIQMSQKYLMYGATIGAVVAGVSVGMTFLDLVLVAVAWKMLAQIMVRQSRTFGRGGFGDYLPPDWARPIERIYLPLHPDFAWAVLLIAAIFLYVGVTSSRRAPKSFPLSSR